MRKNEKSSFESILQILSKMRNFKIDLNVRDHATSEPDIFFTPSWKNVTYVKRKTEDHIQMGKNYGHIVFQIR